jgi:hypothetical protein
MHGTNSLTMNKSLILKTQKKIFMENLDLTKMMFMTGLIRTRRTSDTKSSLKKKLHNMMKRAVQVMRMRMMKKKKKYMKSSNFQK